MITLPCTLKRDILLQSECDLATICRPLLWLLSRKLPIINYPYPEAKNGAIPDNLSM